MNLIGNDHYINYQKEGLLTVTSGARTDFKFIEDDPEKKVFLATDNSETQKMFLSRYGDRICFYKEIKDSDELRKTDVVDAIIDLYICKDATKFKGTTGSSFTGFIQYLRNA